LRKLNRLSEAIASYEKATNLKPDYHEAWTNRGNTLVSLEKLSEAIASYDKAIELKPDYCEAWYNKAFTLRKCNENKAAIACLQQSDRTQTRLASSLVQPWVSPNG
jgi:tetratricopeptide (TPR) repeat protein